MHYINYKMLDIKYRYITVENISKIKICLWKICMNTFQTLNTGILVNT